MAQTILLENTSEVPQQCFLEGERHTIAEHGMGEYRAEVAQAFLEQRGRFVREYEPVELPAPGPGERTVYVANVSGNPFLEPEVTETRITRGKEEDFTVPNPLLTPRVIRHRMMGGQVVQPCPRDPQSDESINLPPISIIIPPYRRIKMGDVLAEWLIRRDMQQPMNWAGQVSYARPPQDFEPNHAWPLSDLRLYAEMMDPRTFIRDHPTWGDVLGPGEEDLETEEQVRDASTKLWRKMFFRVVDEKYALMSQHDWKIMKKKRLEFLARKRPKASAGNRIAAQLEGAPP